MPVHFLDLASATEKLRWAEKEWRELDKELVEAGTPEPAAADSAEPDDGEPHHQALQAVSAEGR